MSKENPSKESAQPQTGFRKKNLVIIALVFAGLWAMAIASESIIFMSIAGVLTLIAGAIAFWAWRQVRRHKGLASVLQAAGESPEARKKALAALEGDKKANDMINVIARAQLLASDEPSKALELLEPVEIKSVPPQMQDDFALLKSQLLLSFGRAKQARPLVDYVNLDNPQRKEMRPLMAAIVGETWARTGSAEEANKLLDSIDPKEAAESEAATLLLSARVFARFGAGKKGLTRAALGDLAAVDPNLLGRFIAPKAQVHPGLQRLAREAFERNGPRRQQGRPHVAGGGGGRRR
ncbi:MAG: hypothetical protein GY811_22405 [Myxococcales bacterium]|nr:hypothetical protein [Myxococcales bacterium]